MSSRLKQFYWNQGWRTQGLTKDGWGLRNYIKKMGKYIVPLQTIIRGFWKSSGRIN